MKPGSILFIVPYPLHRAASQRFRVEAYFPLLDAHGIDYRVSPFFGVLTGKILYKPGNIFLKVAGVINGFLRRLWVVLMVAHRYEFIFIHREASPLGPPVFEWLLAKLLRKKIIFDFDDAIWLRNTSEYNAFVGAVKCFWKTAFLCRWAHIVSAGNDFLAQWAKEHGAKQVTVNPTCVEMTHRYRHLQQHDVTPVTIGWTGSHSTLKYLDDVVPVLEKLHKDYSFRFLVICDKPPAFNLPFVEFIPWREATEIDDLMRIHIGLMPLFHDVWSEGKCGFKLIQYLALGIPAVASPVGVNTAIVDQGVQGYLCDTPDEWYQALASLIPDAALRTRMGTNGKQKIFDHYSLESNERVFLSLFQ